MFRIVTLNANGIRSAGSKGLFRWLKRVEPDVVCLQEIKAHEGDIPDALRATGQFHAHFHCAEKKGYSGTALYAVRKPRAVRLRLRHPRVRRRGPLHRGRVRQCQRHLRLLSVGIFRPRAAGGEVPLPRRLLSAPRATGGQRPRRHPLRRRQHRAQGDRPQELAGNQKNSGFLPEERAWLSRVFDEQGWVDVFRRVDARPEQYTWWSNRGQARAKNVGWRIDYQIATPGMAARARRAEIYTARRFSDHAPLTIEYTGRL